MTICPFALITGGACPGCGMTRALLSLATGDVDVALEYHPLAIVVAIELVFLATWFLLRRAGRVRPLPRAPVNVVIVLTAVAMVAVWSIRYASGTLPPV